MKQAMLAGAVMGLAQVAYADILPAKLINLHKKGVDIDRII